MKLANFDKIYGQKKEALFFPTNRKVMYNINKKYKWIIN